MASKRRYRPDVGRGKITSFLPGRRRSSLRIPLLMVICTLFIVANFSYIKMTSKDPSANKLARNQKNSSGHKWYNLGWLLRVKHRTLPVDTWEPVKDPHSFEYLHNSEFRCNDLRAESPEILLVIFVNSAPKNVAKRAYIRRTFGNASAWPSQNGVSVMRMVFLIAGVRDPEVQDHIHYESVMHNDIVQESFTDDYLNMTRKTIMGMKWVTKFCRRAKYTMKIDDDILLNIRRVLEILRLAPATNFSYGTVHWAKPVRTRRGPFKKWYTPSNLYPHKNYPPYLNGHAYIMSTDVVERVYNISREIEIFPWSDVFIGMCMEKIGVRPRHSLLFVAYSFPQVNKTTYDMKENNVDIMREYVSIYHLTEEQMDQIWAIWTK